MLHVTRVKIGLPGHMVEVPEGLTPSYPNPHLVPFINSCLTCFRCNGWPTDDDAERRNVLPNIETSCQIM